MGLLNTLFLLFSLWAQDSVAQTLVTGSLGGFDPATGERPIRQEIRTFQNAGPAFDLYIQALQRLQRKNQTDILSWYQVAGIHGVPYISWNNVARSPQQPNATGYCPHQSVLFGAWHRPYLALFEQLLCSEARIVANQYPAAQRSTYISAAETLRIPYWDWGADSTFPALVFSMVIYINAYNGRQAVNNPLYRYDFVPDVHVPDVGYTMQFTFRNTNQMINNALSNKAFFQDYTYLLLARPVDYAAFVTTNVRTSHGAADTSSLEGIHDQIHGRIGQYMAVVAFSAFDPIFWLHHANVDRLEAMWTILHPTSYVTPTVTDAGTWTNPPGMVEDINTPLTPFRNPSTGRFFTSADVKSTLTFKYTYPEIIDWNVTADDLRVNVQNRVKALYDPDNTLSEPAGSGSVNRRSSSSFSSLEASSNLPPRGQLTADQRSPHHQEWYINISVNKNALLISFYLHFFLGPPPPAGEASSWFTAANHVGSHFVLTRSFGDTAGVPPVVQVVGQIPITRKLNSLFREGRLASLTEDAITRLLRGEVSGLFSAQGAEDDGLQFRVVTSDGRVVEAEDVDGLSVEVVSQEVRKSEGEGDGFGVWGKVKGYEGLRWRKGEESSKGKVRVREDEKGGELPRGSWRERKRGEELPKGGWKMRVEGLPNESWKERSVAEAETPRQGRRREE